MEVHMNNPLKAAASITFAASTIITGTGAALPPAAKTVTTKPHASLRDYDDLKTPAYKNRVARLIKYPARVSTPSGGTTYASGYAITASERDLIERVIMSSCGGLGEYAMDLANAQVIKDRVQSGKFGHTVEDVLLAPHQFERPWTGTIDPQVIRAVGAVFDLGENATDQKIYYYVNPHFAKISAGVWQKGKRFVMTVGSGVYIHEYWTDANN